MISAQGLRHPVGNAVFGAIPWDRRRVRPRRNVFDIYAVFAALGIGMALPFLLITLYPAVAGKLPKPGAWMVKVKYVLGVALAATAAWLISVLAVQLSFPAADDGCAYVGVGLHLNMQTSAWAARTQIRDRHDPRHRRHSLCGTLPAQPVSRP